MVRIHAEPRRPWSYKAWKGLDPQASRLPLNPRPLAALPPARSQPHPTLLRIPENPKNCRGGGGLGTPHTKASPTLRYWGYLIGVVIFRGAYYLGDKSRSSRSLPMPCVVHAEQRSCHRRQQNLLELREEMPGDSKMHIAHSCSCTIETPPTLLRGHTSRTAYSISACQASEISMLDSALWSLQLEAERVRNRLPTMQGAPFWERE